MSTTFGIAVPTEQEIEVVEVAQSYGAGNGKVGVIWLNPLVLVLPDDHPVIAMDNGPQGVETLGDLRKLIAC